MCVAFYGHKLLELIAKLNTLIAQFSVALTTALSPRHFNFWPACTLHGQSYTMCSVIRSLHFTEARCEIATKSHFAKFCREELMHLNYYKRYGLQLLFIVVLFVFFALCAEVDACARSFRSVLSPCFRMLKNSELCVVSHFVRWEQALKVCRAYTMLCLEQDIFVQAPEVEKILTRLTN